jgi:hypothetical protein
MTVGIRQITTRDGLSPASGSRHYEWFNALDTHEPNIACRFRQNLGRPLEYRASLGYIT